MERVTIRHKEQTLLTALTNVTLAAMVLASGTDLCAALEIRTKKLRAKVAPNSEKLGAKLVILIALPKQNLRILQFFGAFI